MADYDFENRTFDPDGPGIDDDFRLDLTDAIMDPLPPRVKQELNTTRDTMQSLRGEIRESELEAQKKRLVDTFYKEVNRAYGLHPDSIDYDQFMIDADGKTLFWTPGDKKILITTTRGGVGYWHYQHWPQSTEWVVQMHCGDRWDSLVTRGKVGVAPL